MPTLDTKGCPRVTELTNRLLTDATLIVDDAGVGFLTAVNEEIHKGSGRFDGIDETREAVFRATFVGVTPEDVVAFVDRLPWKSADGCLLVTRQYREYFDADPIEPDVYRFPGARRLTEEPAKETTRA